MAVVLLFWSNVELNRCCIASFSPNFHDSLRWFLTKTPIEKNTTMSFLRTFSGKKTPGTSFASRRPIWGDSEVCFDSRLGRISWDVCRQMSKSRRESFSCEENAGSKKKDSIAMGIYSREKKTLMKLLGHLSKHDPRLYALEMGNSENMDQFFYPSLGAECFSRFLREKKQLKVWGAENLLVFIRGKLFHLNESIQRSLLNPMFSMF